MKKLKLKFDGIDKMLNKEQMKKITGGYSGGGSGGSSGGMVRCWWCNCGDPGYTIVVAWTASGAMDQCSLACGPLCGVPLGVSPGAWGGFGWQDGHNIVCPTM